MIEIDCDHTHSGADLTLPNQMAFAHQKMTNTELNSTLVQKYAMHRKGFTHSGK